MSEHKNPDLDDSFWSLTPERILESVESIGYVSSGHCQQLNSLENRVYDVRLEDGQHCIVKFYRPGRWTLAQIQSEHDFLSDLESHEIPVCAPLCFADGQSVHQAEGIFFALWPRTGGRAVDEFSPGNAAQLGRLVARIHNVGAARKDRQRLELNTHNYIYKPLEYLLEQDWVATSFRSRYERAALAIAEIYESRSIGVPLHTIHGDCHAGNLLHGDQGWFFLDFDDMLTGPAVQDLWMLLPARDPHGLYLRELFLEGYRQFRDFENQWLDLIELLRAMRYIHYTAWIARRWQDPAFPDAFPHFDNLEYWQNETQDLEDQLQFIHQAQGSSSVVVLPEIEDEAESELDNSDFFWDWEAN